MARLILDNVSDKFKEKVKSKAYRKGMTYRDMILNALSVVEGISDD